MPAPQIQKTVIHGAEIHYIEAGSGPAVVLVHGTASDYRIWQQQVDALSRRFRVISYSRRWHYPNRAPSQSADYSPQLHAADLAALLRHLGSPAHMVGHSAGALVAILAAWHDPDLVRSAVLVEGPFEYLLPKQEQELNVAERKAMLQAIHSGLVTSDDEAVLKAIFRYVAGNGAWSGFSPDRKQLFLDNAGSIKMQMESSVQPTLLRADEIGSVTTPVLVVAGENTKTEFKRASEVLAQANPAFEFVTIPQAGHLLQWDNPLAFSEVLLRFFDAH